jgi:Zn-dependent membrane protease YugP
MEAIMGIGLGVFLLIAGAVLAFGVNADVNHLDLTTIGYILMGGGVLVILLSLLIFMPRSRRARSTAVTTDAYGRQGVVEREDRITGI